MITYNHNNGIKFKTEFQWLLIWADSGGGTELHNTGPWLPACVLEPQCIGNCIFPVLTWAWGYAHNTRWVSWTFLIACCYELRIGQHNWRGCEQCKDLSLNLNSKFSVQLPHYLLFYPLFCTTSTVCMKGFGTLQRDSHHQHHDVWKPIE